VLWVLGTGAFWFSDTNNHHLRPGTADRAAWILAVLAAFGLAMACWSVAVVAVWPARHLWESADRDRWG
jgi:H+/Cl- antiporter ClcA